MPPDISGQYRATDVTLIGSSISGEEYAAIGYPWSDIYLAFIKEANGKLSYQEIAGGFQTGNDGTKMDITVVGCNNDFTAYFIANGTEEGISIKASTIISGTLESTGIGDFYYASIMLSKGPDPSNKLVPVNTYRVFTDADGLTEKHNWLTN
jgi:hypothetical protein